MNFLTGTILLSWVHKVLGGRGERIDLFFLPVILQTMEHSPLERILLETLAPFFLMMEDYGTKWSLSILYNNILKFFITRVIPISLVASKSAQPQKKKKKEEKKGKKKKNPIAQASVSIWWPDSNTATSDLLKDRTQIKRYACISRLRDKKLLSLQLYMPVNTHHILTGPHLCLNGNSIATWDGTMMKITLQVRN